MKKTFTNGVAKLISAFKIHARWIYLATSCLAALLVLALPSYAQIDNGSITGIVRDSSGAVVSGGSVTIKNLANGIAINVKTNSDGNYQALALIPGQYSVEVSAQGFKSERIPLIEIHVQSRAQADFTLTVGSTQQQVEVQAAAIQLQTQTADVGVVIANKQINDLPLNGRDYDQLALLEPGVFQNPSSEVANPAEGRFSANGNLELQNYFSLDGIDNNSGSENLQEQSVQVIIPPPRRAAGVPASDENLLHRIRNFRWRSRQCVNQVRN